jgi:predicted transcriptional regulator
MENAEVIRSVQELALRDLESLAVRAGIPFPTLYAIARRGAKANPRMHTLERLRAALMRGPGE